MFKLPPKTTTRRLPFTRTRLTALRCRVVYSIFIVQLRSVN